MSCISQTLGRVMDKEAGRLLNAAFKPTVGKLSGRQKCSKFFPSNLIMTALRDLGTKAYL